MIIDPQQLAQCMAELEHGLIIIDAMIQRDGYTQDAKDGMEELLASIREMRRQAENKL